MQDYNSPVLKKKGLNSECSPLNTVGEKGMYVHFYWVAGPWWEWRNIK